MCIRDSLYLAGRPSRWALAHISSIIKIGSVCPSVCATEVRALYGSLSCGWLRVVCAWRPSLRCDVKWAWLARCGHCTASSWAQRAVRVDWGLSYTTVQATIALYKYTGLLFMAALWNTSGHYIFALWFLSIFLFSSPNLMQRPQIACLPPSSVVEQRRHHFCKVL